MRPFRKVVIVGVGLLGGSLALALKRRRLAKAVWGLGRDSRRLLQAKRRGILDGASTEIRCVREADLIVLCGPFTLFQRQLRALALAAPEGCLVTDVGSVKGASVEAWQRAAWPLRFVASHPMAGGELGGFERAKAGLFEGAPVLLTPTRRTDRAALARVKALWRSLGGRVALTTPAAHDALVGRLSHVPHAAAFALMAQLARSLKPKDFAYAGKGFYDSTRVAASDPALWSDIFLHHPAFLRAELRGLRRQLAALERLLKPGRGAALRAWLGRSAKARRGAAPRA